MKLTHFLCLLSLTLLGACRTAAPRPVPPRTVQPPPLEVKKTVVAVEEVRTTTTRAAAEVTALRTSVVAARRDAAALSETVRKVKAEGALAESRLAQELDSQTRGLTVLLENAETRADTAEKAHKEAEASLQKLNVEVTELQARAGAQEQALAQFRQETSGLRAVNDVLSREREEARMQLAVTEARADRWRNTALILGVTVLIAGVLWLVKNRTRLPL